ncbi:signal recognition particle receptor alpha isoform X2 [Oratosquilla oratoria]|uniref:signal recognition particle receptor alpha isoform X2 n=1 Tax=Oratosquilla oratoria TaxID=337810 RepID=UPI003F760B8D
MLDFFAVITKGGLVLWYFQDAAQQLSTSIAAINALIRNVVLQEQGGINMYNHNNLTLKLRMDQEFELLFVLGYQKILQLEYIDKFLSDIQKQFRERFRDQLMEGQYYQSFDFEDDYYIVLKNAEEEHKMVKQAPRRPRTFEESEKAKKTVASMIESRGDEPVKGKKKKSKGTAVEEVVVLQEVEEEEDSNENSYSHDVEVTNLNGTANELLDTETLRRNLEKKFSKKSTPKALKTKSPKEPKKGKEPRMWEMGGKDTASLDFSDKSVSDGLPTARPDFLPDPSKIGTLKGNLRGMDASDSGSSGSSSKSSGGMFSAFRRLVGSKTLTKADIEPVLEKLRDHLIGKNVAADVAEQLCSSVETELEGKILGTFDGISSTVKTTLTDALVRLLTPNRRLDILRDVMEAKSINRPYVITFCGVNGVGKSTNLAKISFWLIENGFRVLIAACDTFRAGAVEQLRTHMKHLNALHPPEAHNGVTMVNLYEQGYGKDAADIARHAIDHSRKQQYDVVLVDTAGRMQDNKPLMRALAKLIQVNEPDLTLFVGEALVGNEAVDQLVKFNRALADHSTTKALLIDGIVLTKFDTIDDKVGAAISMTYITKQPIVFVGTGQTYTDLRSLDAKAVVESLMK